MAKKEELITGRELTTTGDLLLQCSAVICNLQELFEPSPCCLWGIHRGVSLPFPIPKTGINTTGKTICRDKSNLQTDLQLYSAERGLGVFVRSFQQVQIAPG